jgi:hypothetical protein
MNDISEIISNEDGRLLLKDSRRFVKLGDIAQPFMYHGRLHHHEGDELGYARSQIEYQLRQIKDMTMSEHTGSPKYNGFIIVRVDEISKGVRSYPPKQEEKKGIVAYLGVRWEFKG